MLGRARELNPTYSMALNHYANHLFWLWQEVTLTGYVQPGSINIMCPTNPTELIQAGALIQLVRNRSDPSVEIKVVEVTPKPNPNGDWVIKLAAPYTSPGENGLICEVTIHVKDIPEIDDLASRAYHCIFPCFLIFEGQ